MVNSGKIQINNNFFAICRHFIFSFSITLSDQNLEWKSVASFF